LLPHDQDKLLNAVYPENQKKYAVGNEYGTYSYHCALKGKQDVIEEAVKNVTKESDETFQTSNQSNKILMQTYDYTLLGCDAVHIGRQPRTFPSEGYKRQHTYLIHRL
jgi:hypothetical protein